MHNLAVTDVETSGLEVGDAELLELGLVISTYPNFDVVSKHNWKIIPEHIETAQPVALIVNGYSAEDWLGAQPLTEVMYEYSELTKGCVFTAHNTCFDWAFVHDAFKRTGASNKMDYHRLDSYSYAVAKLPMLRKHNLETLAAHLNIESEPKPHRAVNGAVQCQRILALLYGREIEFNPQP